MIHQVAARVHDLQTWNVSLIAQTGLQFDLGTPQGKLIASLMAALAEFERDLLRERIRSGIAAAKAKGRSYRFIARELGLSPTTVMGISHRYRDAT